MSCRLEDHPQNTCSNVALELGSQKDRAPLYKAGSFQEMQILYKCCSLLPSLLQHLLKVIQSLAWCSAGWEQLSGSELLKSPHSGAVRGPAGRKDNRLPRTHIYSWVNSRQAFPHGREPTQSTCQLASWKSGKPALAGQWPLLLAAAWSSSR